MPIIHPKGAATQAVPGFEIPFSLELDGVDQAAVMTPAAGDATKWIFHYWFKPLTMTPADRAVFGAGPTATNRQLWWCVPGHEKRMYDVVTSNRIGRTSDTLFDDTSNWTQVILSYDSDAAYSNAEKLRLWVDQVEDTWSAIDIVTADDYAGHIGSATLHALGRRSDSLTLYINARFAQMLMMNGSSIQAGDKAVSDFHDNGNAIDLNDEGSYPPGTSGFLLMFGEDLTDSFSSGNDFTGENTPTYSTDTPTNPA